MLTILSFLSCLSNVTFIPSAFRALKLKYFQLVAPAIATVLIWQFGLSPIYIVVAGIIGGLVYTLWLKEKIANKQV